MRTRMAVLLGIMAIGLGSGARSVAAQEQTGDGKAPAPVAAKAVRAYHLDFVIKEMEAGKKINSRHYSTDLNAGEADTIKIGTRVPVPTSVGNGFPATFQYTDVGTTIHCRLLERSDDVVIDVNTNISDLALPGRSGNPTAATGATSPVVSGSTDGSAALPPVLRQTELDGVTLLVTDKPMMIASVDDPNSDREFQLEVTATRLK